MLAQVTPDHALNTFHALSSGGPWGLAIFLVLVNIATSYALFKFFAGQLSNKDTIIKSFSEAWDRQTKAFERRTRSENARTEMEALQFAARTDLHQDLKHEATKVLQKIKDNNSDEESAAINQR